MPTSTPPTHTARHPGGGPALVPIRAFRTPVRGYAFASPPPGGQRPEAGLPAELAREPDNPADPLAVAVWAAPPDGSRWRIGYLDRGVAARVAPRLDAGSRVRAQLDGWSSEPEGRWRRPLLLLLPEEPVQDEPQDEPTAVAGQDSSAVEPSPVAGPSPVAEPSAVAGPVLATRSRPERVHAAGSGRDAPRVWGRPPGVRRRRVA